MSLPSHSPTRVSVRLEAPHDIVLNLVKGISSHIYFCVRNDEDKAVTLTIPGFYLRKITNEYTARDLDFMVALAQGIFQFSELGTGSSISLKNTKVADSEASQPTHLVISPGATAKYFLLHRGSRLICDIGLRAGDSYALGFNDLSGMTKCKFSTLEEETDFEEKRAIPIATLYPDSQEYSALFGSTGRPIQIQVVPGTPLPRFQMSFQLPSDTCNLSGSPRFFVRLVFKSLEPRPVTVDMAQLSWLNSQGLEEIVSIFDAATDEEVELPFVSWCFDGDPVPTENYVCFEEGLERTYEIRFHIEELECLKPDRTYKVKMHRHGFNCWHYGKLGNAQNVSIGENKDGVIWPKVVEAAPTFASIAEKTIEAGGTGPFHRLPRELRNMIYENLEATEPDVLYFRTEAGA